MSVSAAARIVAVAEGLTGAAQTIDTNEHLVLPGGIDSHVHIAQPGIVMADISRAPPARRRSAATSW
jgi:dihydroorotase-like cyclic amidohydrolase